MTQPHTSSSIEHFVVIFKENHTYDNYFGSLRLPGADPAPSWPHAPNPPASDHPHDHATWLQRATKAVQQQYLESDLPTYYRWARTYALCNRYFADVASNSTPNHLMLIAADSPVINNPSKSDAVQPPFDIPSLPASLTKAGVSWRNYGGYAFGYISALVNDPNNLPNGSAQFAGDAAAGRLPAVSWVFAPAGLSEHPDPGENVTSGEAWTAQQVQAVVQGGFWSSSVIVITWDDWGGWADSIVDPPVLETWQGKDRFAGTQFRLGSRVPCLVLSPYAKPRIVSSQLSHVSVARLIEDTFGVSPITQRDASAASLATCLDFNQAPLPAPA